MTIVEAIKKVMRDRGHPMTALEVFETIVNKNIYTFHSDNPLHIVRSQTRRHCIGLDFPSANKTRHFKLFSDNKFFFLDTPKIIKRKGKAKHKRAIKAYSVSGILSEIKTLHLLYEEVIKKKILNDLKKISPKNFELFAKKLLDVYGFRDMKMTSITKDGGVDAYGKLKVGLAFMNVAVQCKRWAKGNIGRPKLINLEVQFKANTNKEYSLPRLDSLLAQKGCQLNQGLFPLYLLMELE